MKKIYSLKVARQLCDMGFHIYGTEPNPQKPWLNVFLFKDSMRLSQALTELTQK